MIVLPYKPCSSYLRQRHAKCMALHTCAHGGRRRVALPKAAADDHQQPLENISRRSLSLCSSASLLAAAMQAVPSARASEEQEPQQPAAAQGPTVHESSLPSTLPPPKKKKAAPLPSIPTVVLRRGRGRNNPPLVVSQVGWSCFGGWCLAFSRQGRRVVQRAACMLGAGNGWV